MDAARPETDLTTPAGDPFGRKVIHVDMDAFFASVEQRDNPDLRGKPVAVGGSRERGVVAAASYEARKFGVHSALSSAVARRRCPGLIFVPSRFDVYKEVSGQIREIFHDYTPLVEPLSLDEAYLDVTENLKGIALATEVAREVRARIFDRTALTASAGVSYCKFLAKVASDQRKPNGMFVIPPAHGPAFVAALPVAKFHGIGERTAERMHALGIHFGADIRDKGLAWMRERFGKAGEHYHSISLGIDTRPVNPDRIRKSVGAENTFERDLSDRDGMRAALGPLLDKVWRNCEAHGARGRTVTLKAKYADFEQVTRARSLPADVRDRAEMEGVAFSLLDGLFPLRRGVRLLGVSLSGFDGADPDAPRQLDLGL